MSVKRLIDLFSKCEKAPTSLSDIRDQVIETSGISSIPFYPFSEPVTDVLGMLVRWNHTHVYGSVTTHCAVCYNENAEHWVQRLVCCKEMMHVFDAPESLTATREDLNGLLDNLLGLSTSYEVSHVFLSQSLTDQIAVGQALAILYPISVLEALKALLQGELTSIEKVGFQLSVPVTVARYLLSPFYLRQTRDLIARYST